MEYKVTLMRGDGQVVEEAVQAESLEDLTKAMPHMVLARNALNAVTFMAGGVIEVHSDGENAHIVTHHPRCPFLRNRCK